MWSPWGKWKNFFLLEPPSSSPARCFHDAVGDGFEESQSGAPAISTSRNNRHRHTRHPIILPTRLSHTRPHSDFTATRKTTGARHLYAGLPQPCRGQLPKKPRLS